MVFFNFNLLRFAGKLLIVILILLIGIRKSAHTRHHAENVVVGGIDIDSCCVAGANSVVGDSEEQCGVVNAGQVAGAAWLMLLWLESEGVDVDTNCGDVGVVLVRLDLVEISSLANLESVVAVELEESSDAWVLACHALNTGD